MKTMLKKSLALILALTMVFGAAPLAGLVGLELPSLKDIFADKAEAATYGVLKYKISNGEVTITNCDKSASGELAIPDEIEGFPVTSIGVQVFSGCSGLTSVIIPKSVTSIGGYAFEACSSLTSVYYTGNITGWCSICFDNSDSNPLCKAENFYIDGKKVEGDFVIPDSVTSIGNYAFYKCTGLTSVTIPDSVTSIGNYAFAWCDSLTNITIPDNVTNIGYGAFCGTIIYKDSSNWENNVLYIGNHLIEAKSDLSGSCSIKENTIAIADNAFSGCTGLTSITIPNSVTSIGEDAFRNCSGLTSVTIGNSVTSIGNHAFASCYSLTNITIPNSVTSIGDYAFYNCVSLTSVTIPNSVMSIGDFSFYCCTGLTSVTIGNSVTSIGDYAFKWCDSLTNITIPDSVTSIGDYAFYNCASLASVTIPNSVMSIGDGAFTYCKKLITITVDGSNQYYSSDENGALFNKDKTELIQYPAGRTATEYTIPDSVTSLGNYAFQSCTGLTSVIIPDSVTSIGNYAFSSCTGLTSVTIPNSVMSIGDSAFRYCSGLTSVTIPNSVTMINSFAFAYCSGLTSAIIPDGVASIGDSAFLCCYGLTSVTIPSSVTMINSFAFASCSGLTSATIPNSVIFIGDYVFQACSNLTDVYYSGTEAEWGTIIIQSGNDKLLNANIHFCICGDNAFWMFDDTTGRLIINGTGTMNDWIIWMYTPWHNYCSDIKSVIINSGITSIGDFAFSNCTELTNVAIPDSVTSIGDYAFYHCTGLTSITVDKNNQYYSSDENGVLFNKVKTELIQYPIGRTATEYTIPDSVTSIGENSFVGCESLSSVTIGNSVTSIGDYAFLGCTGLTSITVDENNQYYSSDENGVLFNKVKTELIQYPIGRTATEYIIPDSVTSIGESSFVGCENLLSVTIGNSVTSIGNYAFEGCTSLTDVYYRGSEAEWNSIKIGEDNENLINANIHFNYVPDTHEHSFTSSVTKGATCTGTGEMTYACKCGYSYTEEISAKGHTVGAWEVIEEPTTQKEGKKVRKCTECKAEVEQAVIPKLTEEPVVDDEVVKNPSTSSISYGDSIILHVDSSKIPEDGYVEWTASNGNFDMSVSADGTTCKISPKSSGKTVFTATVYDQNGNIISSDTQEMTAKAGFFDKIIAFFKKLFGMTKTIPEALKNIL
ncbi:MAG: leucine-rich repeat domain-containing protein [Acutalibacteraceae bacterium]